MVRTITVALAIDHKLSCSHTRALYGVVRNFQEPCYSFSLIDFNVIGIIRMQIVRHCRMFDSSCEYDNFTILNIKRDFY